MAYVKTTPKEWVQILCENRYDSAAGARKSIGRLAWAKEAKEYARVLVELHFNKKKLKEEHVTKLTELVEASPVISKKRKPKLNGVKRQKAEATSVMSLPVDAFGVTPDLKGQGRLRDLESMASSARLLMDSYGIAYESFGGEELEGGSIPEDKRQILNSITHVLCILDTLKAELFDYVKTYGEPACPIELLPQNAVELAKKIKTALRAS